MNFGIPEKSTSLIKSTLMQFPEVHEAIIFGSRAMGNYKNGSDIDMALKGPITEETVLKIKIILDQELPLPYMFDIVNYNTIDNPDFKEHIDKFGKIFYSMVTLIPG